MNIRPYRPADRAAILAIHQRQCIHDGLGYVLPSPDDPRQFATIVAEEDGRVVAMASSRRIAEGQTVIDPLYGGPGSGGTIARWNLLARIIRAGAKEVSRAGYTELLAATHPGWRGYGRRLVRELGFVHDLRAHYYKNLCCDGSVDDG